MKRKRHGDGFTLVELMIVVAIIGILAAIAIPAFSRYVKKSRAAEAPGHLNKMWSSSVAYYEADHTQANTSRAPRQFPGAAATLESACCGQPGDRCPGSTGVYQTDPVWVALDFNVADTHYFRPTYESAGTSLSANFTATVHGDLDCDGTESTFRRVGIIDSATGDVETKGNFVDREIE